MNQEHPTRSSPVVEMKNLIDGMRYRIRCINQLQVKDDESESTLVQLESREGHYINKMWPICPFSSEDVANINAGRTTCTMMCRSQRNVLSVILDKEESNYHDL